MVSCNNGNVKIEGSGLELMAELSYLLKSFKEVVAEKYGKEFAEEIVNQAIEVANTPDEEIIKNVNEKLGKSEPGKKTGNGKRNSKYHRGQKFNVEIAEVHTHYTDEGKPYNVYRIKGFNTMMFDDYGIDRLINIALGGNK